MANNYLTEEYLFAVADAILVDEETGIQLATSSLKSHNIAQSVDTTEIKAGQDWGNYRCARSRVCGDGDEAGNDNCDGGRGGVCSDPGDYEVKC